ncbi:hypothetical protein PS903_06019 [Pseudomonas fluorescens]|nr:hypothetical protein PS903_06019 [Pseudomonas fluorescens]
MDLGPGLNHQRAAGRGAAVAGNTDQLATTDHRVTQTLRGVQFVALDQAGTVVPDLFNTIVANQAVAVSSNLLMAVMTDPGAAVVEDHLLEVALGAQVDQLLSGAIFNRQLVVSAIGRRAAAAQHGFGLVLRQGVRHGGDPVGHATGNQRIIRIAFQKGHHHFHADARDGHRAETVSCPAG